MASLPWSRVPCLGMLCSCFSVHEEKVEAGHGEEPAADAGGDEFMARGSRGLAIAEGNGGNGGIHDGVVLALVLQHFLNLDNLELCVAADTTRWIG